MKILSNVRTIYLDSITNNIELIWNAPLENTSYMFYNISQITEVDLSNVYTEQLTNMSNMFQHVLVLLQLIYKILKLIR